MIAPTRELAMQVKAELTWLYAETGARIASCVGGMDSRGRGRARWRPGCHIVVGTPGRLRDHLERGRLDLSAIRAAVLDEADEMLDLGFREELEFMLDATPGDAAHAAVLGDHPEGDRRPGPRATSATRCASTSAARDEPHGDIEYRAVPVAPHDVERAAVNVLRYFEAPAALVFCATREGVRRLHGRLLERGFAAVALSGELSQHERTRALQALRDGRARVCVATDVAARGLDLPDLDLVIHADLPTNKETMLHRSGRTGRAGRKGVSVLLVPYARRRRAEQLFAAAGVDAGWSDPPSAELIRERDQERLLADPRPGRGAGRGGPARSAALLLARFTPGADRRRPGPALARASCPRPEDELRRGARPSRPRRAARRRGRRRRLVPALGRPPQQRRPEMADAADLPARRRHQGRDRRHPHLRPRDQVRDRARRGARFAEAVQAAGAHEPRIEPALPPSQSRPSGRDYPDKRSQGARRSPRTGFQTRSLFSLMATQTEAVSKREIDPDPLPGKAERTLVTYVGRRSSVL